MDRVVSFKNIPAFLWKYKYVVFVLLIGLIFMLVPSHSQKEEPVIIQQAESIMTVEQQLGQILSCVDGAGKVQVMLTLLAGEETLYQMNHDNSVSGESSNTRADTIIVTDSQRNETGLIKQVIPPVYLGAIVVCEGADKPAVQLAIVEAVSRATGLGADRISVLRMK